MATAKQITANQKNAKKSTGPKTTKGKQIASLNALRHGLTAAQTVLLPDEDVAAFEELGGRVRTELTPVGEIESALVELIIGKLWRLGRVACIEAGVLRAAYYEEALEAAQAEVEKSGESVFPAFTEVTGEEEHKKALAHVREVEIERDQGIAVCGRGYMRDAQG